MAKRKPNTEVVRVDPTSQHQTPAPVPAGQVIVVQDPHTGQNVQVVQDPNTGHFVPVQLTPQQQPPQAPAPGPSPMLSDNAIGRHRKRRIRVVEYPDGTRAYEMDEDDAQVNARTVPDDYYKQQGGNYADRRGRYSQKRLIIGVLLAILLLMVFADVMGVPHVRTEPGTYVSLEGAKEVENTEAPLVILKRLDRSVFGYATDAVGWVFSAVGGALDDSESQPSEDRIINNE